MAYNEVEAAKAMIKDDTRDLSKYFEGFRKIYYLYSYERLYEDARRDILTWNDARESFMFDERQDLFWSSHRSYSHFILLSHAVVEYLSTRILLHYFDPTRGQTEMLSAVEGMGQFNRQDIMQDLNIITGRLNADMNRVRGIRNDFAHEVDPHFQLGYDKHPLVILNDVRRVTDQLVEILYGESYQQIIDLLDGIFSDTFPDDYSEASTAELIEIYQFDRENGALYNQQPARELHERGVDPEIAPPFEEFESIDYLNDVGITRAGWKELSIVQLRATPFVPNAVDIEKSIPIELQIEFSSNSMMNDMPGPTPDTFEWYCYLMIDDRVVAIHPSDKDGCPAPRKDGLDEEIAIKFDYIFKKDGDHNIEVGLQITNASYRYHLTVAETETKAYGPFTS